MAAENVCNLTMLQHLAKGKTDFLIKLLQLFVDQVPQQVQQMQVGAQQADWQTVSSLAHQLKANFDTIGIACLHQPIRELESNARQQVHLTAVPGLLAGIQATVNQAVIQLKTELEKLKNQ